MTTNVRTYLQRDGGGEVVVLFTGSLQQGEPDDNLSPVLWATLVVPVAGVGDLIVLAGGEVEGKILLLEPPAVGRLPTVWLQKCFLKKVQSLTIRSSP